MLAHLRDQSSPTSIIQYASSIFVPLRTRPFPAKEYVFPNYIGNIWNLSSSVVGARVIAAWVSLREGGEKVGLCLLEVLLVSFCTSLCQCWLSGCHFFWLLYVICLWYLIVILRQDLRGSGGSLYAPYAKFSQTGPRPTVVSYLPGISELREGCIHWNSVSWRVCPYCTCIICDMDRKIIWRIYWYYCSCAAQSSCDAIASYYRANHVQFQVRPRALFSIIAISLSENGVSKHKIIPCHVTLHDEWSFLQGSESK